MVCRRIVAVLCVLVQLPATAMPAASLAATADADSALVCAAGSTRADATGAGRARVEVSDGVGGGEHCAGYRPTSLRATQADHHHHHDRHMTNPDGHSHGSCQDGCQHCVACVPGLAGSIEVVTVPRGGIDPLLLTGLAPSGFRSMLLRPPIFS